MGVIGRPQPHHNFDGKILMKRVSKVKYISTRTTHNNFSHDAIVNSHIKMGEWRKLVDDTLTTPEDLKFLFLKSYGISEEILNRLEFFYKTKVGSRGNYKRVVLTENEEFRDVEIRTDDDKGELFRKININDLCVQVRCKLGDTIEEYCNCDISYMLGVMDEVGSAIRRSFH